MDKAAKDSQHVSAVTRAQNRAPSNDTETHKSLSDKVVQLHQSFGNAAVAQAMAATSPADGSTGGDEAGPTGLPLSLKAGLETLSGMDLSDVRVHSNSSKPAQLDALAYTQGRDIHLGPNQEKHLPHEGWHVVQQMQGRVAPTTQTKGMSINDDTELEREADVMGARALHERHVRQNSIKVPESVSRSEDYRKGIAADATAQQEKSQVREQQASRDSHDAQSRFRNELLTSVRPTSTLTAQARMHNRAVVQRNDENGEGLTTEFFNLSGVQEVRANMERRFHQATSYASRGLRAADTVRSKLLALSGQYENAYNNYAAVVRAGQAEAENQEQWINICVGIGAGVLLGLTSAYVFPTAAAGWLAISAGEVAGVAGSALGQAGVGALITKEVAESLSVAGTDLEPGGLDPNVLELDIWRNVSDLYRTALHFVEFSRNTHMLSNAAEFLIGEIRVHVAGGETQMSQEDVLDLMVDLVTGDQRLSRYDIMLSDKLEALGTLQSTAESISLTDYTEREMEQDIWILWMAGLSDPSVLDLDEIEDYLHGDIGILGSGSRLGVDFGWWTSEDDEQEARNAAQSAVTGIRARQRNLSGGNL